MCICYIYIYMYNRICSSVFLTLLLEQRDHPLLIGLCKQTWWKPVSWIISNNCILNPQAGIPPKRRSTNILGFFVYMCGYGFYLGFDPLARGILSNQPHGFKTTHLLGFQCGNLEIWSCFKKEATAMLPVSRIDSAL